MYGLHGVYSWTGFWVMSLHQVVSVTRIRGLKLFNLLCNHMFQFNLGIKG